MPLLQAPNIDENIGELMHYFFMIGIYGMKFDCK